MKATDEIQKTIEAVWHMESARLIAGLVRMVRDVDMAEDMAQEALLAAMERWPVNGVPNNPGAWLMTVAKRRAIDQFRSHALHADKQDTLEQALALDQGSNQNDTEMCDDTLDDLIGDDLLRLMFIACHPALPTEARTALTLRLLGGLTTGEIARAFLVSEPTMAQRIVRAKRTIAKKRVAFENPSTADISKRLPSLLEVIYLVFNEGYSATAGDDLLRPALCDDAMRLGRILAQLAPQEAEVHGLVALMEIQASRLSARTGPDDELILLQHQNRARWNHLLIQHGLTALEKAKNTDVLPGPYILQAEIAACHARAKTAEQTDWQRITALYEILIRVVPSPVIRLNHAVAVAMAFGPAAGLERVDALRGETALDHYYLFASTRGDFLFKLKRFDEAGQEFERAAKLTQNRQEQQFLLQRLQECHIE